jgi:hypothetical protein
VVGIAKPEVPSNKIAENGVATTDFCKQEFNVEEHTLAARGALKVQSLSSTIKTVGVVALRGVDLGCFGKFSGYSKGRDEFHIVPDGTVLGMVWEAAESLNQQAG